MNNTEIENSKKISLSLCGLELERDVFFLTMLIINLVLTIFTIVFAIPAIICLILYCSDKNFKHGFFNCFTVYNLVLASITTVVAVIYILLLIMGLFFGDDLSKIFFAFVLIFYLFSFAFTIWYLFVSITFYKEYDIYVEEFKNKGVEKELVSPTPAEGEGDVVIMEDDELSKKLNKNDLISKQVSEKMESVKNELTKEIKEEIKEENKEKEEEENKEKVNLDVKK